MSDSSTGFLPAPPGQATDADTLAMAAAAKISRRIETLAIAPGSTVTERELAAELGVGKAPVREALLRLSGTGLVTPRSGSGYVVAPLTLRHARSLLDLWRFLERGAIDAIAERGLPQQLLDEETFAKVTTPLGPGLDAVDAQVTFHFFFCALSMNEPLLRALPRAEIARLLRFASALGADATCSADEHETLWRAVANGDVDTARAVSEQHLRSLEKRVLERLMTADTVQEVNLASSRRT